MTTTTSEVQAAVKAQVEKIVASGEDIRRRLAKLVSEAACRCQESGESFVKLTRSAIDGARAGLAKSMPNDQDGALRQVVDGLGDGLSQTALAARLAVEEAASSSRQYTETELRRLRDDLTAIRDLFAETVTQSLEKGKTLTDSQLNSIKTHANQVAERMGPTLNEAFEAVVKKPVAQAREKVQAGVSAGQGAAESLCQALSRVLKAAGDELDQVRKRPR